MKAFLLLLATVAVIDPAFAADKPKAAAPQKKETVMKPLDIDTNKDGKISLSEAQGLATTQFGMYDGDKNGSISLDEYRKPLDVIAKMRKLTAAQKAEEDKVIKSSFTRMDNDSNGSISKDEYLADAKLRHATMDMNHDGFVTPAEVDELQKKIKAAHEKAKAEAKKE